MTRVRTQILIFVAALVLNAQCLSACTFAPCHQEAKPKSCHQTGAKPACSHESLASPAKVGSGLEAAILIASPIAVPEPVLCAAALNFAPAVKPSPPPLLTTILRI